MQEIQEQDLRVGQSSLKVYEGGHYKQVYNYCSQKCNLKGIFKIVPVI